MRDDEEILARRLARATENLTDTTAALRDRERDVMQAYWDLKAATLALRCAQSANLAAIHEVLALTSDEERVA